MSAESKVRIFDKVTAKNRVPPGLFDKGYARTIALPGLAHLTKQDVRNRQGAGFCKSEYNPTLEAVYEDSWRKAVFLCRKEYSLPDPEVGGVVEEDNSGSLTHDEESAIEKESKDRQERQCYTFPMSLNTAIAPSLKEHADVVADLCKSKQIALTNMTDELFCLVMKTTLLLADQRGRRPSHSTTGASSAPSNTFNIMALFPEDFQPRCAVSTTLPVSPIPDGLEELLVPRPDETTDAWTNDLRNLLGYDHLGYLYARFLGPDGTPGSSSEKHPLWTHLADLIELQDGTSRIYPLGRTTDSGDHPLLGLSNLVCEIRQEMATNIENLWKGSAYNRALDYFLRFSLRFRLAGQRENKYYTARCAAADNKTLDQKDKPKPPYTRKAWKDDVERSQDIFGKELRQSQGGTMDEERYRHLMSFQYRHAESEPGRPPENLTFQDRLTRSQASLETTGILAPHEDLDEEDDRAEQEKEQIERKSPSDTPESVKEPSRAHLKSIQAVARMLLESPSIQGVLSVDYVRKCFHQPELASDEECAAIIDTVNALQDYVPKRQLKTSGGTDPPVQHVATMIGLILIANQVVRIGGYSDFAMRIAPRLRCALA
ncbi:MAG: hypothetical protein J3R72DRAFT_262861 [Linnemannia gamsii]|nr:MAG: hypothetical protein J3R72DRAFT_262861 [Linnemannia gamsii]